MPDRTQSLRTRLILSQIVAAFWLTQFFSPVPARAETENPATGGSIQGDVRITRKLPAQRMRFRLYPGYKSIPPPTAEEKRDDEWQNIVIYLKSAPALSTPDKKIKDLQMVQLGETFIPHVLPIVKGSTVRFPNQDPIFHNVFSLSATKSFDLGRYPKGDSRSVVFDEPGIVPVFCHLHSDMSAIILVLENPYFAVPDAGGRYRIENVPAGNYTLVAWHERSEQVERQVEVESGQVLEVDITVPIEDDETPQ
jgi:plastocyanin